jgi:hypothetical protein
VTYKPPSKGFDPPTPYRPEANEQPSTLPKDTEGQAINEHRRREKQDIAALLEKHAEGPRDPATERHAERPSRHEGNWSNDAP